MVGKLFKHEIQTYSRILFIVNGLILLIAFFGRLVQFFEFDHAVFYIVMASSVLVYYVAVLVGLSFNSIYTTIRFYKNLFTGEGYLTFTLPATPNQLLLVKLGTALLFDLIAFATVFVSFGVFTCGELGFEILNAARYLAVDALKEVGPNLIVYGIEIILLMFVSLASGHLTMFSCICIGQLFKKNRILAAVGVYVVYYLIGQAVSTVIMVFTSIVIPFLPMDYIGEIIDAHPYIFVHTVLGGSLISSVIFAVALYLLCRYIMTHRLNLE